MSHLYGAGFLGTPRNIDGQWQQWFLWHSDIWLDRTFPSNAPFAVVHPALSALRCKSDQEHFYRSKFIVGHGLWCPEYFYPGAIVVTHINQGSTKQLIASFQCNRAKPVEYNKASNSVAYCFLFSLLFALHREERRLVTIAEIVDAAKDLSAQGFLASGYGRPAIEPHKYLQERLAQLDQTTAKGSEAAIRQLTDWFNSETDNFWSLSIRDEGTPTNPDLCFSIQTKLSSSRKLDDLKDQSFSDADPLDIDVRVRLARRSP